MIFITLYFTVSMLPPWLGCSVLSFVSWGRPAASGSLANAATSAASNIKMSMAMFLYIRLFIPLVIISIYIYGYVSFQWLGSSPSTSQAASPCASEKPGGAARQIRARSWALSSSSLSSMVWWTVTVIGSSFTTSLCNVLLCTVSYSLYARCIFMIVWLRCFLVGLTTCLKKRYGHIQTILVLFTRFKGPTPWFVTLEPTSIKKI